jgi:hypothetical protein
MGLAPAKICPVIIPGRLTRPITIIELMVGIMPMRIASRTWLWEASQEGQQGFNLVALGNQSFHEAIEAEGNAVEGVAQHHS